MSSSHAFTFLNQKELAAGEVEQQCHHKLHLYPTSQMQDSFENMAPLTYTIIVAGIFIFVLIVFLLYDYYVMNRQAQTDRKLGATDRILAQIFPTAIRERMFAGDEQEKKKKKKSKKKKSRGQVQRSPSMASSDLSDFIRESDLTSGLFFAGSRRGKPLADLYPEATLFFADIPGFAAWSSIRQPVQIFELLETIFQSFDEIAKRRRVFKVETVGDCYVAAVGVPEPNSDHALVMARFARLCMQKFRELVFGLEIKLGPDTGDLGLRIGLHSGPVTAGVLRGDRARFQLFGDTMNTTARHLTTGMKDCVHISEQTADLLFAAGKKRWIIPRADQVEAKGKGKLKTFWLRTKTTTGDDTTTGESSSYVHEGDSSINDDDSIESMHDDVEPQEAESLVQAMNNALAADKSSVVVLESLKAADEPQPESERRRSVAFTESRLASNSSQVVSRPISNNTSRVQARLIDWNCELLSQMLKLVLARRERLHPRTTSQGTLLAMAQSFGRGDMVVNEVADIITLPDFDETAYNQDISRVELAPVVREELHSYVALVASMYRDNPFHNFEHASHVTMSVSKLLSRIVAPKIHENEMSEERKHEQLLHDHTYGITSDPLTQFAVMLSALIHDVDHRGVPNFLLASEDPNLAAAYQNRSIAEQNSVDIAWNALMSPGFRRLRECIFSDIAELRRFRQLLVNSVIATDIFDKELGAARKARWDRAFQIKDVKDTPQDIHRKATIVIEHLIQASDVAHTMQHWHVYQKWNERLFTEMYLSYLTGRSNKDPSENWYQGEIGFFDNYIIPLAKKLKECGVFGVASDEYLNYAEQNRRQWETKGHEILERFIEIGRERHAQQAMT